MALRAESAHLCIEVEDGGSGFATAPRAFHSGKRDGSWVEGWRPTSRH
ncbi:MAG: hypothetical protein IPH76_18850 [Xanthomonadales bacterium]|nr:hypothetical protein [Xanthomonadales bacterium]